MAKLSLTDAAAHGDVDRLQEIQATSGPGALNAVAADGHTAAHWAAKNNHLAALEVLLEAGADLNRPSASPPDALAGTPLHW